MGKMTFVEHDDTEHVVEFKAGASLMQIAVDHMIPGIDADCGGNVLVAPATSSLPTRGTTRPARRVMRNNRCCP